MTRATRVGLAVALLLSFPGLVAVTGQAWAAPAPGAAVALYPGVASQAGANFTQWRSESVLANDTEAAVDLLLELLPRGQSSVAASLPLTLAAGETRRLPDLYAAMHAASGAGMLRVTGDVLAWVRTFNQGATGSFGQDVPPVTAGTAWSGGVPVLFPITTPADTTKDFRSNLLLVNLETTTTTFSLASGTVMKTFDVGAGAYAQISGVGSWLGLPAGTTALQVSAGGAWSGTVSTVDPVLGDPTTVRGLIPTTRTVALFPGIASTGGNNGTLWRSEAVLLNQGVFPKSVTLEIIPRGTSAVAATKSVSIGGMQVLRIADIYAELGAASGAGTLRVTGDVLTWVRTFNQGSGATFGQDVPEVTPGVGFGPGATVAFPISTPADSNRDFRSNFLVINHESRAITLTFGAGAHTRTLDVPAGSYVQQNGLGSWLGVPAGFATVSVAATGRWSGTVSTVDPYLGDPTTVIGIMTTPNPVPTAVGQAQGSPVSATIGTGGGTLTSADARLSVVVPAGALAASKTLTQQPITDTAHGGLGVAYRLGPDGTTFAKPVTLRFTATADDTSSADLAALGVAYQDSDGYWHWVGGAVREPATGRVSITTTHFTDWALVNALTLIPSSARVEESHDLGLQVQTCYPPGTSLGGDSDPLASLGTTCTAYSQSTWGKKGFQIFTDNWAVNGVNGGDSTHGTIAGSGRAGLFTAPAKKPDPPSVEASVDVSGYGLLLKLRSHITVGKVADYTGTFNVTAKDNSGFPTTYKFKGDPVTLTYQKVTVGTGGESWAWVLSGKITDLTPSIMYGGAIPCGLTSSTTKDIPASYFLYRPGDKKERWVLEPTTWTYTCQNLPAPLVIGLKFEMSAPGDCRVESWVPEANFPDKMSGQFTDSCSVGISYTTSWEFLPKQE